MESTQLEVQQTYEHDFADGEVIFEEGDEGLSLYIVQSGRVQISRGGRSGTRLVGELVPGDFFGEMSVVLGESRTARATAVGPTRLLELDGETLEAMCIERPEIAIRMIQRLATRLIGAERRLAALGLDELVEPLVRYLSEAFELPQADGEVRIEATLHSVAEGCSMTLSETHHALHQLMDQKLVRLEGTQLIAPDAAALATAMGRFGEAH